VLGEVAVPLTSNDPDAVVEGIAAAVRELAARHPSRLARRCPVGVQLGGPVKTSAGVVEFYDKPLHDDDESWKGIPLGDMLRSKLGRRVLIFNDAAALAAFEAEVGFGPELPSFAIVLVGQGIGAKLVRRGRIESFPMEIGIVEAVNRVVEEQVDTLEEAATAAGRSEEALQVFSDAGRRLARAMANIQAVVDPEAWAVYGPPVLLDSSTPAGRIFLGGLRTVMEHLDYNGLRDAVIVPRPLSPWLGARAAAAAVLRFEAAVSAGGTPRNAWRGTAGGRRGQQSE
jgi:predicted NBD/HSP70 family sugar kinase